MWSDLGVGELIQYENGLGFRPVIRSQTPENPEGQELKTDGALSVLLRFSHKNSALDSRWGEERGREKEDPHPFVLFPLFADMYSQGEKGQEMFDARPNLSSPSEVGGKYVS